MNAPAYQPLSDRVGGGWVVTSAGTGRPESGRFHHSGRPNAYCWAVSCSIYCMCVYDKAIRQVNVGYTVKIGFALHGINGVESNGVAT